MIHYKFTRISLKEELHKLALVSILILVSSI